MGDVIDFGNPADKRNNKKKQKADAERRASTLCRNGHHRWAVVKDRQFDVKRGKLVTTECCQRCGKLRTRAT